ncbi:hypothetical protein [Streptomyces sp. FZ201]|uniref:hypothetical protein n=1 Tax=Streptomyces sp. FZ201 TaxID=3057122 RepID=UPI0021BE6E44|nr:hypothetical protein [Streptomyces sp. FZ201]
MRAIRVASAALLGLTALTFTAPVAQAKGEDNITPFGFSVLPSTIAAGGQVSLRIDRDGGCKGPAVVTSAVFDTVTIPPKQQHATAVVDWDAKPGATYKVTFTCDHVSGHTDLTIAGGRTPTHHPVPDPLYPTRGAHAGAGGSLGDFDLKEIGLGAALIAGSIGAAYRLSRKRTADDGG